MKIAIIAAMKEELAPFREAFESTVVWQRGKTVIEEVNPSLYLVESGIGKANAAATSAWLCDKIQPDLIINTGTTGSFSEDVALGSVVYSPTFAYSDVDATGFGYAHGQVPQMPADYPINSALFERVTQILESKKLPVTKGLILTSDSFMSDVDSIEQIRRKFPEIVAGDMESAAIAQIASFYEIPVLNIRGISDHVGKEAPETFNAYVTIASENAFTSVKTLVDAFVKE